MKEIIANSLHLMKLEVQSVCEKWMLNINENKVKEEEHIKNVYKNKQQRMWMKMEDRKKIHKIVEEIKKKEN